MKINGLLRRPVGLLAMTKSVVMCAHAPHHCECKPPHVIATTSKAKWEAIYITLKLLQL